GKEINSEPDLITPLRKTFRTDWVTSSSSCGPILVISMLSPSHFSVFSRLCNLIARTPSKTISLKGPEYPKWAEPSTLFSGDSLHALIQSCSCGPSIYPVAPSIRRRDCGTSGILPDNSLGLNPPVSHTRVSLDPMNIHPPIPSDIRSSSSFISRGLSGINPPSYQ